MVRPGTSALPRARARQRGATLVVVVLVITLLMGIGAFAARSAHLATASSGYERHQTQTRYVAEYGLMMATTLFSGASGQSYLRLLSNPVDRCYGQASAMMVMPTCYKMFYRDVQTLVGAGNFNLCDSATVTAPGSLGMVNAQYNAECDFAVELTDKVAGTTPPGFDTGAGKSLKFFYVTASVTAQVRIVSSTTSLDPIAAESSGTQTLRSRILTGPFPAN